MKNYKIKENAHSSKLYGFLPHVGFTLNEEIEFECKFDKNCLYKIDTSDKYDINKLYGFSTSYFHHIQSARVGWRCLDGESIEILTYCYDNSVRIPEVILGIVKPEETFNCKIIVPKSTDNTHFTFIFEHGNKSKVVMVKKEQKSWGFKYKLFPYFGGNLCAPHKMNIYIKEL